MQNYQKLVKTKKKFRKIKLETLQNVVFAFIFLFIYLRVSCRLMLHITMIIE